jgi:hypothetical protein
MSGKAIDLDSPVFTEPTFFPLKNTDNGNARPSAFPKKLDGLCSTISKANPFLYMTHLAYQMKSGIANHTASLI